MGLRVRALPKLTSSEDDLHVDHHLSLALVIVRIASGEFSTDYRPNHSRVKVVYRSRISGVIENVVNVRSKSQFRPLKNEP
jgi:hypothetical protein